MSLWDGAEVIESPASTVATLPPIPPLDSTSMVENYLRASDLDASQTKYYAVDRYSPDIQLVNIGPAAIAVGSSNLGVSTAGTVSFYFGDMLNRHQIAATVEGVSNYGVLDLSETLGGEVNYLNQTKRFQWGARLSHWPSISSAVSASIQNVDINGMTVPAEMYDRLFQVVIEDDLSLIGQYPLSQNNRVETAVGTSQISFKTHAQRDVFPAGFSAYSEEFDLPSPSTLDLNNASIAFVRDTSRFGFVSPIRGMRFRAESEWTSGDLNLQTSRLDWRRYYLKKPLSFGFRALHLGRYGRDSEDSILLPLDIANGLIVRGYQYNSFRLRECTPIANGSSCPEVDRLVGSRIAAFNAEARLALLGTEDYGLFNAPYFPTDLIAFVDAGAAWSAGGSVTWKFDRDIPERVPVVSAGFALRTFLFGALPLEWYYAHPFQRPDKYWVFGFQIRTGF
jgi:hypothetical protein